MASLHDTATISQGRDVDVESMASMMSSRCLQEMVSLVLLGLALSGCGPGNQDIAIALDYDEHAHRSEVVNHVVAVYEDGCDFIYELAAFIPVYYINTNSSQRRHLQFFDDEEGEPIGELEPGTYAFVGLGLDDACRPYFIGCTERALGASEEIIIEMNTVDSYIPFCGLMSVCNEGRCPGY